MKVIGIFSLFNSIPAHFVLGAELAASNMIKTHIECELRAFKLGPERA